MPLTGLVQASERLVIDKFFGAGAAPTLTGVPATWHLGLFTAAPTETTAGTEVSTSGTAYARVAITNNATNFPNAASAGPASKASGAAFTFPVPTANWGTVTHFGFFDAAVGGGALWAFAPLTASKVISLGDGAPAFASGALTITGD